ncbi:helix-turn-helix domain-containing protein [Haladaptatus sp. NG-WS-4]
MMCKRLQFAITYKQGVTQTELAEWNGLSRKTVYNWLQRFEEDSIRKAASDKPRSGRPLNLDPEDKAEVCQLLGKSPVNAGYDAEEWSILLAQQLLDDQFDVTYSRTGAYRLLSMVE